VKLLILTSKCQEVQEARVADQRCLYSEVDLQHSRPAVKAETFCGLQLHREALLEVPPDMDFEVTAVVVGQRSGWDEPPIRGEDHDLGEFGFGDDALLGVGDGHLPYPNPREGGIFPLSSGRDLRPQREGAPAGKIRKHEEDPAPFRRGRHLRHQPAAPGEELVSRSRDASPASTLELIREVRLQLHRGHFRLRPGVGGPAPTAATGSRRLDAHSGWGPQARKRRAPERGRIVGQFSSNRWVVVHMKEAAVLLIRRLG
jgi:hypothetical protein